MTGISYVAEVLTIDGQRHSMPYPIEAVRDLGLLVVVLFDPGANLSKFGQFPNLVAVRRDGSVFWTAELPSSTTGECYYKVRGADDEITAYSFGSYIVQIDPLTGRILSKEFVK
jgi:hypothetical protein